MKRQTPTLCPYCRQPIDVHASRCQHCHATFMAASTARVLSRVMPAVLVILAIIGVVTRQYSLTIVALAFAAVIHFNR